MKRMGVLILVFCAAGCGQAPTPAPPSNKPANQAPAPRLQAAPETAAVEEWIDVDIPVDLKTEDGKTTIRKGKYLVSAVRRTDGAMMTVDSLRIGKAPGKSDFTIPTSGYSILPEITKATAAALRGGSGKATLWIRIAGTNGEWGSAIFDVDPKWTGN